MSIVYWRQNFDPNRATPQHVQDALKQWGGTNEYGESLWRVILAGDHEVLRDGVWHERDSDQDTHTFEPGRNGVYEYHSKELKPEKTSFGPQWIPLYPVDGWILERWFPAHCFGGKEAWEAVKSSDGFTPMMGPYPARGDYWMMKGPWDLLPPLEAFRRGISSWENSTKHMHGKIDQALFDATMANFMKLLEEKEEAQYLRVLQQAKQLREESMKDIMNNPRLCGWRNKILNERGMTGHY